MSKALVFEGKRNRGVDPLLEAYRRLRQVHRMFDGAAHALEQGIGRPCCIQNCGLCCEQNTAMCTTLEAIHAVSVLTGLGKMSKALGLAEGWLLERHSQASLYEGMPIGFALPKLRDEWEAISRTQCPFLTSSKECFIHDVRPLVCRAFGVTRDTVSPQGLDFCPRPVGKGETPFRKLVVDGTPIREAWQGFRDWTRGQNKAWVVSGFLPTVLFRVAKPEKFKALVDGNYIASAKLIGIEIETSLLWQPQVEMLRQGMSPDLIVSLEQKGESE